MFFCFLPSLLVSVVLYNIIGFRHIRVAAVQPSFAVVEQMWHVCTIALLDKSP